MTNKSKELNRVTTLLSQALSTALASMPNNRAVAEASGHIKTAIRKIDGVNREQIQKKKMSQSQFENWWSTVQSGVANQPMSQEARQKSLKELNKMISIEQAKIDQLEKQVDQIDQNDQLIQE